LPVLLPAVAVAALVLGVVLVVGAKDTAEPVTLVVETASDAVVEQSGGVVDARPGQSLAEGAEIRTGPDGSAVVGGVRLGPAERAVVRGGHVRRIERRHEILAAPVTIELDVRRGVGGRLALRWTRHEGDDFAAYVLFRDGTVVTARRNPDRTVAIDRIRAGRRSRYVVVVLDRDRHVIARSQIVMG
jgi:hypothetical protein